MTEWSFPTTRPASPNANEQEMAARDAPSPTVYEDPINSAPEAANRSLSRSQVLGGYAPQGNVVGLSPKASKDVDISVFRCVVWALSIWLPLVSTIP